ncbi:hypothetical protein Hanom_Chr05g00431681 [Helianthus anomalus]
MTSKRTRSSSSTIAKTIGNFITQNFLKNPEEEVCRFSDLEISQLKSTGVFPESVINHPYDQNCRSDFVSRS